MLSYIWTYILYQPLFNALIWIYENLADKNMGWSVVWLTIFLRLLLLPLTIISEKNAYKEINAEREAAQVAKSFKYDAVARKEIVRKIIKKNKISPAAKVATLLVQVLVLLLLYQVFVHGMSGERILKFLYPFIDFPGKINNNFYGFDISKARDSVWAGICAVYLFVSIIVEKKGRKNWSGSEVVFLVLFPVFTFFVLWLLPMVKSLFILTSMVFSDIVTLLRKAFFPVKTEDKKH